MFKRITKNGLSIANCLRTLVSAVGLTITKRIRAINITP